MDIDSPIATMLICRRNCGSGVVGYYIVEVSEPREIDAPSLAPNNVVELRSRARVELQDDTIIVVGAGG